MEYAEESLTLTPDLLSLFQSLNQIADWVDRNPLSYWRTVAKRLQFISNGIRHFRIRRANASQNGSEYFGIAIHKDAPFSVEISFREIVVMEARVGSALTRHIKYLTVSGRIL